MTAVYTFFLTNKYARYALIAVVAIAAFMLYRAGLMRKGAREAVAGINRKAEELRRKMEQVPEQTEDETEADLRSGGF